MSYTCLLLLRLFLVLVAVGLNALCLCNWWAVGCSVVRGFSVFTFGRSGALGMFGALDGMFKRWNVLEYIITITVITNSKIVYKFVTAA